MTRQLNISSHTSCYCCQGKSARMSEKKQVYWIPAALSAGCQDWGWEANTRLLQVYFQNRCKFLQFWFAGDEERWMRNGNLTQQTPGSPHYRHSLFTEEESKTWLNSSVFHLVLWWWDELGAFIVLWWVLTMVRCRRTRLTPGGCPGTWRSF